jgi:hypothetical protein
MTKGVKWSEGVCVLSCVCVCVCVCARACVCVHVCVFLLVHLLSRVLPCCQMQGVQEIALAVLATSKTSKQVAQLQKCVVALQGCAYRSLRCG